MRILVTNDDGVDAEGLHALAGAMRRCGDVTVVAPATNQTGVSRAITLAPTIAVDEVDTPGGERVYRVAGTPCDCVRFSVLGLGERPELVVSGINRGVNLGDDVAYSGTVAAGLEAVFQGLPAIAFSQQALPGAADWGPDAVFEYAPLARFAERLVEAVAARGLPGGVLLNVNGPGVGADADPTVRVTRLGRRIYGTTVSYRHGPDGSRHYELYGDEPGHHQEEGTDLVAVADGCISVSALRLRLDDDDALAALAAWELDGSGGR
jgi:5'-nucleotidase